MLLFCFDFLGGVVYLFCCCCLFLFGAGAGGAGTGGFEWERSLPVADS